MLHALIMAGGSGTRFWPRSRRRRPKQFLTLSGDRSLLQQAVDRLDPLIPPDRTWVITNAAFTEETGQQLPTLASEHIVGEPCGRNTAPCVGLGAALIFAEDPGATMVVAPADHVIEPPEDFRRVVQAAECLSNESPAALITFGIPPTFPATGYGYIQRGDELRRIQGCAVYRVRSFREKPPADLAKQLVETGENYWNSGIFVWKAATILEELRIKQPRIHTAVLSIVKAWTTTRREDVLRHEYEGLGKISIDYAVMEKARQVFLLEAPFRCHDFGSWLAIERVQPARDDKVTVLATHVGLATSRCVIVGDPSRLIATLGVRDLIIVQDGDATLIADRNDEGNIKQLLELLHERGLEEYL
jgi:mannose-1-phosphate guanylyltransferase